MLNGTQQSLKERRSTTLTSLIFLFYLSLSFQDCQLFISCTKTITVSKGGATSTLKKKLPSKSTKKVPITTLAQGKQKTPHQWQKHKHTKDDESEEEIVTHMRGDPLTRHFAIG